MNAWLLIRRLWGPAFVIMVGVTALLNQWGVLSFSRSWPLYLILAGVLGLAERAALAMAPPMPPGYPGPYGPNPYMPGGYSPASSYPPPPPQQASISNDDPLAGRRS
jgi:hypothetical protein